MRSGDNALCLSLPLSVCLQVITPSNAEATQLKIDLHLNKAACFKRLSRSLEVLSLLALLVQKYKY